MGGQFRNIEIAYSGSFERYMEGEQCIAVILGTDTFTEMINGRKFEFMGNVGDWIYFNYKNKQYFLSKIREPLMNKEVK